MPAKSTEIAVIIVNYGTADLAIEAVESVRARRHGGRGIEIHLVDNASPNGDAAILQEAHETRGWGGSVILHLERVNHGFGRGNNVVLRILSADSNPTSKVFFLNPDSRLENEAIDALASFLDVHPEVAVVGAAISRPGSGGRVSAAFNFPGLISEFTSALSLGFLDRMLRRHVVALPADLPAQRVDWVSGAAFMARFDLLEEIGFFDDRYFLYFEEVDLMRRLSSRGHEVWYLPEASVVHVAGASTGMKGGRRCDNTIPVYWFDSWRIYFSTHYGRSGALGIAFAKMAAMTASSIIGLFWRKRRSGVPGYFKRDFSRYVIHPLLFGGRSE